MKRCVWILSVWLVLLLSAVAWPADEITIVPNAVIRSLDCANARVLAPLCTQLTPEPTRMTVWCATLGVYQPCAGVGGGGCMPSGAAGEVLYGDGAGGCSDDPQMTYNDTSNTLTTDITSVLQDKWRGSVSGTLSHLPAATTTSHTLTWPAANASGVLTNNGAGTLSWSAGGGGSGCTVPGSDTQVIFNDGGDCGADSGFLFLKTPNNLIINVGSVGSSGVGVFALGTGVAPTTAPQDSVQLVAESLTWTDAGNTDAGLGIIYRGLDGNSDPALNRHHLGMQVIFGSNLENTRQISGVVIDTRDAGDIHLSLKASNNLAHGITTLANTDVAAELQGTVSGLAIDSYSSTGRGYAFGTVVTTESNEADYTISGPFRFLAQTKSGTAAAEMALGKRYMTMYRGSTTGGSQTTNDEILAVTTDGNLALRGMIVLNSHVEAQQGYSPGYGGSGTGRVAGYIYAGNLVLATFPNDSNGTGSGNAGDIGIWTDDIDLLPATGYNGGAAGRRILVTGGGATVAAPTTTNNHMYFQARGSYDRSNGTEDLSTTGMGIVGQDGTRLFLGKGGMGGDREPVGGTVQDLIVKSESVEVGATNGAAGTLKLSAGTSTGNAGGTVEILTPTPGASGTDDRTPSVKWSVNGAGALIGHGSTSGTVSLTPAATTTSYSVILPDAQGTGVLANNGSGVLSWAANPTVASSRSEGATCTRASSTQTLTTGTAASISCDTEVKDDNGYVDIGGNPTRLTVPATDWYIVVATTSFPANATGIRQVIIRLNGTTALYGQTTLATAGDVIHVTTSTLYYATAGDYFEMRGLQTSGGNLDLANTLGAYARFSITRYGQPAMPAAETITAGATITADGCGGLKRITAAGAVTTNTTNTFTAPAAGNSNCVMEVVNTGAHVITLDNNANFVTKEGRDIPLKQNKSVIVASTGASGVWYQISETPTGPTPSVSATSCGTTPTIAGHDKAHRVTVDGTGALTCTVTFATAFATAPSCTASNETTANLARATATTTTVAVSGTAVSGDKFAVLCAAID